MYVRICVYMRTYIYTEIQRERLNMTINFFQIPFLFQLLAFSPSIDSYQENSSFQV